MNKSEEEQRYEDEEQIKYLKEYATKHKKWKEEISYEKI